MAGVGNGLTLKEYDLLRKETDICTHSGLDCHIYRLQSDTSPGRPAYRIATSIEDGRKTVTYTFMPHLPMLDPYGAGQGVDQDKIVPYEGEEVAEFIDPPNANSPVVDNYGQYVVQTGGSHRKKRIIYLEPAKRGK